MDGRTGIELTDEQAVAVRSRGGHLCVRGGPGTGKTTSLLARYVSLLADHAPSELLVICRNRAGADRFRDAVLDQIGGGFDWLPITTFSGLAYDIVSRHDGSVSLLTRAEQVEEVAALLKDEGWREWPTLHGYLGRRAFVDQVAEALAELDSGGLGEAEDGVRDRSPAWAELCAFAGRYRAALAATGAFDFGGLLARAVQLLRDPEARAAEHGRYRHVLIDDYHVAAPVAARLVSRLAELGAAVTVALAPGGRAPAGASKHGATLEVTLTQSFRRPAAPQLVVCNHPAIEAEAIAGELVAARQGGRDWGDMAVLVRSTGARARAIVAALARHGIPFEGPPPDAANHPTVRAIVDVLRLVDGQPVEPSPLVKQLVHLIDELAAMAPTATPANLAFEVWHRGLAHLVEPDDATLDAVTSFIGALQRRAARRPDERLAPFLAITGGRVPTGAPRQPGAPEAAGTVVLPRGRGDWFDLVGSGGAVAGGSDQGTSATGTVTVTSIAEAAGREWHTVVIAGCVEGELPRLRARPSLFDPSPRRAGADVDPAARRQQALADERRLFESACDRATGQVIGMVAATAGLLPSRFVESWATSEPQLISSAGRANPTLVPTEGATPACPDGHLRLSASQLSTYDDCPLRYAYEYVLGAKSDSSVYAALGNLVHTVLAEFLDPDSADITDLGLDRLMAVADKHWSDDIAPYRPQIEEIRRDYFRMLKDWWEVEGGGSPLRPEVLDTEHRFEIEVGPHTVTGFIDRVDRADDGTGIRVVDYKTGRTKPNATQLADNIQLAVYHLGATADPTLTALGPPTQLRLLFLRDMKAMDQEVTADHALTTTARVLAAGDVILAEQFAPSVDADCRTCSYHRLCPLQDEGRQVAG